MKKCPYCKTEIRRDSVFCGFCGQKVKLSKEEKEQAKLERQKVRGEKRQRKIREISAEINANRLLTIESYRQNSDIIIGVQILAAANSCENCRKYHKEVFSLNQAPNLPVEICTSDYGYCRCTYISVLRT